MPCGLLRPVAALRQYRRQCRHIGLVKTGLKTNKSKAGICAFLLDKKKARISQPMLISNFLYPRRVYDLRGVQFNVLSLVTDNLDSYAIITARHSREECVSKLGWHDFLSD